MTTASQHAARSNAEAAAQPGKAAAAAATASSTSAGLPSDTCANAWPEDGLTAVSVPPPPLRHCPPTYISCSRTVCSLPGPPQRAVVTSRSGR